MRFDPWVLVGLCLSAAVAIGLPPLLAALWWKFRHARWKAFGVGAATFAVSQFVLRMPWQIPLGAALAPRLSDPTWLWSWLLVSCLTAGLFEETGRYVAYRWFWKDRSTAGGVMLGLGHGGLESMLLIGLSLGGSAVVYVALSHGLTLGIPADTLPKVTQQFAGLTFGKALLGGVERISALIIHLTCSLLVLRVFTRSPGAQALRWLWASMAFHFAVNLVGVAASKLLGALEAEAFLLTVAALAAAWCWRELRPVRSSGP